MKGSRDFKQNCFFSSYSGVPGIRHILLFSPNSISKNNKVRCIQYNTDCDFGCCLMFLRIYLHLCVCVFMGEVAVCVEGAEKRSLLLLAAVWEAGHLPV